MIKNKYISKISGLWFWERWHPEVALRYLRFVDLIKKGNRDATILEVGTAGLGICPYLKRGVTGVDQKFNPPIHPLLKQVNGSALALPFPDSSYDIVLSVDMLEHLTHDARIKAIQEMVRVAKTMVLLGVPCGKSAYGQDMTLDSEYSKKYGTRYHFLEEQVIFGLPEENDIKSTILKGAKLIKKKVSILMEPNENLNLRLFLMRGWISENIFAQIFYRKILLLFLPILKLLNSPPVYRQLFIVTISQ